MVKALGLVDVFAGIALFSIVAGVIHLESFLLLGVLLLIKGGYSFRDIGGVTDLVAFILIISSFFVTIPSGLIIFVAVVLTIKGGVSLLS